jgi:hypothetical protein
MRTLLFLTAPLLALGLLGALAAPRGDIHSHLLIEPGKEFILGGDQPGSFQVKGRNTGPVPVEVRERLRNGQLLRRAVLAPGAPASLSFQPGATALLRNLTTQTAVLDLVISGSHPSRMTAEPARAD